MAALKAGLCGTSKQDLLSSMGSAIEAMEAVITEKMHLFGSVNKAHLHETPYARMLAAKFQS
jgi:tagatose 1,6-diphosphate aldolase GatY/KbaY